jgi:hypothetical protein
MLAEDASTEHLGHDHIPSSTPAGGADAGRNRYVDFLRAAAIMSSAGLSGPR